MEKIELRNESEGQASEQDYAEMNDNNDNDYDEEVEVSSCRSRLVSAKLLDLKVEDADFNGNMDERSLEELFAGSNGIPGVYNGNGPEGEYESQLRHELSDMDSAIDNVRNWRAKLGEAITESRVVDEDDVLDATCVDAADDDEEPISKLVQSVCEIVPESSLEEFADIVLNGEKVGGNSHQKYWATKTFKAVEQQLLMSDRAVAALRTALDASASHSHCHSDGDANADRLTSVKGKGKANNNNNNNNSNDVEAEAEAEGGLHPIHDTPAATGGQPQSVFLAAVNPTQSIFAEIEEHIRAMELQYIEANIRAQTQFQRTHSQLLQAAQLGSCTDPEQTIIEDGLQMQEEVLGLQAQIAAFEEDLDLLLLRSDKL